MSQWIYQSNTTIGDNICMCIISENRTYEMLNEERVLSSKDDNSVQNKFTIKPEGILLTDTFNNPFFPIPRPAIDTAKFDLADVYKQYQEFYGQGKSLYLPFHFCITLVGKRYYIFNTRPIDMKFPIDSKFAEANKKKKNIKWDNITEVFFKYKLFDISEAIHVCLIGNSELDVYTNTLYKLIGQSCMYPILRQNKVHGKLYQNVLGLNLGRRFNLNIINKYLTV